MATTCDCVPTNGSCNADCSITCSAGFGDCDASVSNGCETALNTISDCGECSRECSCYGGAMCINGACAGTPEPNGTPCSNPVGVCSGGSGVCMNLICGCGGEPLDMARESSSDLSMETTSATGATTSATSGHGKSSGCSVGEGAFGGMLPIALLLLYAFASRRRSRRA